jgi:aspartokinase
MLSLLKFGGNALELGEKLQQLVRIVARQVCQPEAFPVVVISAMKGLPEQLQTLARLVREGKRSEWLSLLEQVKQQHRDLANDAVQEPTRFSTLERNMEASFLELDQDVLQLQLLSYGSPAVPLSIMRIITWGEHLAVSLVTAALEDAGVASMPIHEAMLLTARHRWDHSVWMANETQTTPVLTQATRARARRALLSAWTMSGTSGRWWTGSNRARNTDNFWTTWR